MSRFNAVSLLLIAVLAVPSLVVAAEWQVPRLANGQPDLQGLWTNVTRTPLERRADLGLQRAYSCLLYTSPSPRDQRGSRMPSSA